jgi:hypothetical protein
VEYRRVPLAIAATAASMLAGLLLVRDGDALCARPDCIKYHGTVSLRAVPAAPGYTQVEEDAFKVEFTIVGKIKGAPQRCRSGRYFSVRITTLNGSTDVGNTQDTTGRNGTFTEREEVFLDDPAEHPNSKLRPGGVLTYQATVSSKAYVVYPHPLEPRTIKCAALRSRPVEVPLPEVTFPPPGTDLRLNRFPGEDPRLQARSLLGRLDAELIDQRPSALQILTQGVPGAAAAGVGSDQ